MSRWNRVLEYIKDPSDVVDYTLDFSSLLQTDTIDTASVSADGVTVGDPVVNGNKVTVFVSGGNASTSATVTTKITTTNATPRVFERSFKIKIQEL